MTKKKSDLLKNLWHDYNFIIIFLIIFLAFLIVNGSSTSWTSITNIFLHSSILGTIALGMGLVVLTGDFDLSSSTTAWAVFSWRCCSPS